MAVECLDLIRLSAGSNMTHEDVFYTQLTSRSFQPFHTEAIPFQLGWDGLVRSCPLGIISPFSPSIPPPRGHGLLFSSIIHSLSSNPDISYHRGDTGPSFSPAPIFLQAFGGGCWADIQLHMTLLKGFNRVKKRQHASYNYTWGGMTVAQME